MALDGLYVAVSPVCDQEFSERQLPQHLEDLTWLEATARAHDAVVRALATAGPILPLRLATVYLTEESLRTALVPQAQQLRRQLTALDGAVEWGVTVDLVPQPPQPARAEQPAPRDGKSYLRQRRNERQATQARHEAAQALGQRLAADLASVARDMRWLPAQNPALHEAPAGPRNVVNQAYLVPGTEADAFKERLRQVMDAAPAGLRIRLSGPWAPYNFTAS